MVFDETRRTTLLFGGFGQDGEPKGDTWGWNGESWQLLATTGPSPRRWPAVAFDSRREVVFLFGGREGVGRSEASLADTWLWNGAEWRESASPGPRPSGRDHHRAVYDRRRERVVLFGGWMGTGWSAAPGNGTGANGITRAPGGPEPRAPFGMAYHDALGIVVLMGGQGLERTFADTWTWDGTTWTHLVIDGPGARAFHAMTYDADRERILLYGGREDDRLFRDLWSWDGSRWEHLSNDGPVRRGIYASAYDSFRGTLIIHGSGDLVDERWELDSSTWTWVESSGWREIEGARR